MKTFTQTLSTLFIASSLTLVSFSAQATDSNPFQMISNSTVISMSDSPDESKCGASKEGDSKCGTAKCGSSKEGESKCGSSKCGTGK